MLHSIRLPLVILVGLILNPARVQSAAPATMPTTALVYFNGELLAKSKAAISNQNPYFLERYQQLLAVAEPLLAMAPNPVVNKTMTPPSGDHHDYLSYAPYRWPDESKSDGLPWKAIDGVTNPVARGDDTDWLRLQTFSDAIEKLSFAYYFSDDSRYGDKVVEMLRVWFVDPATRVNPNLNYTQAVPGLAEGRAGGLIDWSRISRVITAVQLLDEAGGLPVAMKATMDSWFAQYLNWLLTNPLGQEADALPQNHANWYNFQVVGLMTYLGRLTEAKAKVEDAKTSRISAQILPSGEQPKETGRTKSMHYSSMNLWALTNLTSMGRKLGIDLWEFATVDGRSLPQAYAYLEPFALRKKPWPFKQITPGGAEVVTDKELKPLFSKTAVFLQLEQFNWSLDGTTELTPLEALQFPSPRMLQQP
jgi:hypothetical protein